MSAIPLRRRRCSLLVGQLRLVHAAVLVEPPHDLAVLGRLDDRANRNPCAVQKIDDQRDPRQQRSGAEPDPSEDLHDRVDRCVHVADPPLSLIWFRAYDKAAEAILDYLSHLRESNP